MAKYVRALQLPTDKHRRSLPKQIGINLMAAMGVIQQLISPAAPSQAEQVESFGPVVCDLWTPHWATATPSAATWCPQYRWT